MLKNERLTPPDNFPTLDKIRLARQRLDELIVETPVWKLQSTELQSLVGKETEVFCKLELFQCTGSFKPRGALLSIMDLSQEALKKGVVAASAGNHAIAVSYAALKMGTTAKVVMPKHASSVKMKRCRDYGAEVILEKDIASVFDRTQDIVNVEQRNPIHPFEGPMVALGTGTVGLELCSQVKNLEAVIIPVGGGGLCGGIAAAVKQLEPSCEVFGVEPEGADTMMRSFKEGKPAAIERVNTIAESLGAPYALPYSYSVCRAFVDGLVTVDDLALCRAMNMLFYDMKLAVEPAGVAGLAALCGPLSQHLKGKRVGLIISGTNIDSDIFCKYLNKVKK